MGNDGGSIPTRRELVKSAARAKTVSELKATVMESLGYAWSYDPISSETLDMENVVSDWRGRLYNYETILKGLMPNDDEPVLQLANGNGESEAVTFASTGIKSLRDVAKLKFKRYTAPGTKKEIWACPISLKELGPATKAVYLVPCGHVFAEVAMRQMEGEHVCPECSEDFKDENIIPILPTDKADLEMLSLRIEKLRAEGLSHSLKKDKSASKKKRKVDGNANNEALEPPKAKAPKIEKKGIESRMSSINNVMAASLTAKVIAEQEVLNKKRKLAAAAR